LKLTLPGKHADDQPPAPELYDILRDPFEKENLAAKRPVEVKRLRARIAKWWPEGAASLTA
jgi:hypothetical protein